MVIQQLREYHASIGAPGSLGRRLVYVNALMVQDVLADGDWAAQLTEAHRRGRTPLFWT